MTVTDWLLDSDPALRWQVLRDLEHAPDHVVAAERARVVSEGWGARLLALRDPDGQWAGGAYFPARPDPASKDPAGADPAGSGSSPGETTGDEPEDAEDEPQPWTATTYSLLQLRDFGVDPGAEPIRETIALVRENCRWEEGGQRFFDGETEQCINGMTVALGAYFGEDVHALVTRLVGEQLDDGGWNCWAQYGATCSSVATTLNVLDGLWEHERATGGSTASTEARRRGEEYLLQRGLFRRRSTGAVMFEAFREFSYPTRWHYDVLRALDYFRSVGGRPDPRLVEAVELVRTKRQPDGTWLLENTDPGAVHFTLEDGDGRPSRWNTLRALRVLHWYDEAR